MTEWVFEDVPAGFKEMPVEAVYRKGKLLVLLGTPPDEEDNPEGHDCDLMGCGSVGPHVIAYGEIVKECASDPTPE